MRTNSFSGLSENAGKIRLKTVLQLLVAGPLAFLLGYFCSSYSASAEFFLIVSAVFTDEWHVPGRSMHCSQIQFQTALSPTLGPLLDFEEEWSKRFHNSDVIKWKDDYLRHCSVTQNTLSAVLSSGRLTSPGLGLACNANFALTTFLVTNNSVTPRNFQLLIVDWNYVNWSTLFRDFTSESNCPIVRALDNGTFQEMNQTTAEHFHPQLTHLGEVDFGPEPHLNRELNTEGYVRYFETLRSLQSRLGLDETFRRKSLIARAVLELQPNLKEVVKTIWSQLTSDGATGYSAVHIRRGDKTGNGESTDFPILLYYRALRRLCHANPTRCSQNVYVFCDNSDVCQRFKTLAGNCFQITDFSEQISLNRIAPWYEQQTVPFKNQTHFNSLPAEDRLNSAKELLISVYLAALSDFFVCTYSSNICRLVALLKNGTLSRVDIASLDWRKWTVL